MQLNQSPKININYCAKIVEIHDFTPNPKCERAHIDGYTISVSKDKGLTPVTELYYGYAKDLYPDVSEHWNENFIQRLAEDKNFFMEELSPECHNDVPHEGIVIRIEDGLSGAYKLKCNRFLFAESKALDKGEVDIESDQ